MTKVRTYDKDDVEIKKPPKNMIGVEKLRSKFFTIVSSRIIEETGPRESKVHH